VDIHEAGGDMILGNLRTQAEIGEKAWNWQSAFRNPAAMTVRPPDVSSYLRLGDEDV
jgi:hypothetical protein